MGFTLVEMLVVAAIVGILLALAVVSLRALGGGVQEGAARTTLKTVLASARADAASRGHVVGVRIEQYRYPCPVDSLRNALGARTRHAEDGATYAVIVYPLRVASPQTWAMLLGPSPTAAWQAALGAVQEDLFVAAPNREPVRFPAGVELAAGGEVWVNRDGDSDVDDADADLSLTNYLAASTTFTILFSPTGQIVIRPVAVIQRHNRDSIFYGPDYIQPNPGDLGRIRDLDPRTHPENTAPMLLWDDRTPAPTVPAAWLRWSQNALWIYEQNARKEAGARPWSTYLKGKGKTAQVLINPYTGQLQEPS